MLDKNDYKELIFYALMEKGIIGKNHDYFSRIRGQIRAITDSKEEYQALRDDILNSYQNRFDNNNPYTIRFNDNPIPSRFGGNVTDKVKFTSDPDKIVDSKKWSEGYHTNFDEKESCYNADHLKKLERSGLKYYWVLGKNGLIISKYNAENHDELPRDSENNINAQPRLVTALEKHNEKVNEIYVQNVVVPLQKVSNIEDIGTEDYRKKESEYWAKTKTEYTSELIDNLNSCLMNEGLTNQRTGEPLFNVKFIKNGK